MGIDEFLAGYTLSSAYCDSSCHSANRPNILMAATEANELENSEII